jgi:uncharacterized membrane protein YedE/YeeE
MYWEPKMKKPLLHILFAFSSGIIFGLGLILAGMSNPSKVLAFLDITGLWDPSLMFVMGGAIGVGIVAFAFAKKRTTAILGGVMHLPTKQDIDQRIIFGGILFGIGWGIGGICPGPGLVLLGAGSKQGIIFVLAMLIGITFYSVISNAKKT